MKKGLYFPRVDLGAVADLDKGGWVVGYQLATKPHRRLQCLFVLADPTVYFPRLRV